MTWLYRSSASNGSSHFWRNWINSNLSSANLRSSIASDDRIQPSIPGIWRLFALTLAEYADEVDALRVLKMLLVHDIVEIDAGDVPLHSAERNQEHLAQAERRVGRLQRS
jgi:putative hydrolases of HD superfamily